MTIVGGPPCRLVDRILQTTGQHTRYCQEPGNTGKPPGTLSQQVFFDGNDDFQPFPKERFRTYCIETTKKNDKMVV